MSEFILNINGERKRVKVDGEMPLLWVLRDTLGYTGTKFGCGRGLCGACTIHIDGEATRSCVTAIDSIDEDVEITTIEGLSESDGHPVQQAWFEEDVPQCGYCQSGQIMTAAAFLERNPDPTDSDINTAMKMNICRCGSYPEIKKAIHRAAGNSSDKNRADNE
tara:strand:+ start:176 stop:664 length:489 start_codon:yes stop_codon:yes gene_type:complete